MSTKSSTNQRGFFVKTKYVTLLSILALTMQTNTIHADAASLQAGDLNEKTLVCVKETSSLGDRDTYLRVTTAADPARPVKSAVLLADADNSGPLKILNLEFLGHNSKTSISHYGNASNIESANATISLAGSEIEATVVTIKNSALNTYRCSLPALAGLKPIYLDNGNSISRIEASIVDNFSWTIENFSYNTAHPELTTELLTINFVVLKDGCGGFNERASLIQVDSKQKIEFFTVQKTGGGSACGDTGGENRRKFSVNILLARFGSDPIQIAENLQLRIFRKENPGGPQLKPVFDHIELIKTP